MFIAASTKPFESQIHEENSSKYREDDVPSTNSPQQHHIQCDNTQYYSYNEPKISVVTATYNSSKTLAACIENIQSQLYKNVEQILIDGGSTDTTIDIIKQHANMPDSKISFWMSEPDDGVYHAWNKLADKITGDWIIFIGSDDMLHSNETISSVVPLLNSFDDTIWFVYGQTKCITSDGRYNIRDTDYDKAMRYLNVAQTIPFPSLFIRKEALIRFMPFNTKYKICGDYDFLCKSILRSNNKYRVKYIDILVTDMMAGGLSSKLNKLHLVEMIDIAKHNGVTFATSKVILVFILRRIERFFKTKHMEAPICLRH